MEKITRSELAEMVAERLTDVQDMDSIVRFFYEHHLDFYRDCDDDVLVGDALDLNVIDDISEVDL